MARFEKSSPPAPAGFSNLQEEIAYYKSQYEQLETELQDFQASSKELEAELEKDVEASERRERNLREKVDSLNYEVDEWKTKYKQSKSEANSAQNALQKEITELRETSRAQQLRLRDIEVANDDFERQARHTTSSLEDMESKYNVALERSVMLEEEMKTGEQERERLRIDAQRLKDELSDLKIEADILQDRLRGYEAGYDGRFKRISQLSDPREQDIQSSGSEGSNTSASAATNLTPPPIHSESSMATSDALTPPSPPFSEPSSSNKFPESSEPQPMGPPMTRDTKTTPKPTRSTNFRTPHGQTVGRPRLGGPTPAFRRRPPASAPKLQDSQQDRLPRTESLYQFRSLIGKMQKLEQRVQSARSKLPAPTSTPPRASPRADGRWENSSLANQIPLNVTIRSGKKRGSASTSNSATTPRASEGETRRVTNRQSRLSFGFQQTTDSGRPDSRASNTSHGVTPGPASRAEISGVRSGADSSRPQSAADMRRPTSSMGGTLPHARRPRPSQVLFTDEDHEVDQTTPTPRRTLDKGVGGSAIPAPTGFGRRQSNAQALGTTPRRQSTKTTPNVHTGASGRSNEVRQSAAQKPLGETF